MADLGAVLASEARGHDHIGQYSPDRFVAVLATDPDDGHRAGEAFMRRVHERWIEQRSAPVDITAGIAPARLGTHTAVLAALHANERAAPSGDAPWVCAVATDYA